jgi:hypothetical protein
MGRSSNYTLLPSSGKHEFFDPRQEVQRAEQMKVHSMLVIGNRDLEANAVSLRVHGQGNLGAKPRAEGISDILQSIAARRA